MSPLSRYVNFSVISKYIIRQAQTTGNAYIDAGRESRGLAARAVSIFHLQPADAERKHARTHPVASIRNTNRVHPPLLICERRRLQ